MARIGVIHPGAMGSRVAALAGGAGHEVAWCAAGRSDASRARAQEAALRTFDTLGELSGCCEIILSIVPPHGAIDAARAVAAAGFRGLFCDANAVAPSTAHKIAAIVEGTGAAFVDGSLIGPPPAEAGDTRLYLSGERAREVAALFDGSILEARVLDAGPFAASAIKMCFAAWTKGTSAMLLNTVHLARSLGVDGALIEEWNGSIPELPARVERLEANIDQKAWRFIGEMDEIARAFESCSLPSGFHAAAARVYRTIARNAEDRGA